MRVSGLNLDDRCININYKYIYVIQMNIGHIHSISIIHIKHFSVPETHLYRVSEET